MKTVDLFVGASRQAHFFFSIHSLNIHFGASCPHNKGQSYFGKLYPNYPPERIS